MEADFSTLSLQSTSDGSSSRKEGMQNSQDFTYNNRTHVSGENSYSVNEFYDAVEGKSISSRPSESFLLMSPAEEADEFGLIASQTANAKTTVSSQQYHSQSPPPIESLGVSMPPANEFPVELADFFSPQEASSPLHRAPADDDILSFFEQRAPLSPASMSSTPMGIDDFFSETAKNAPPQSQFVSPTYAPVISSSAGEYTTYTLPSSPVPPARPPPPRSRAALGLRDDHATKRVHALLGSGSSVVTEDARSRSGSVIPTAHHGLAQPPALTQTDRCDFLSPGLSPAFVPPLPLPSEASQAAAAVAQREAHGASAAREQLARQEEEQREDALRAREAFLQFSPDDEMLLKVYCLTWNMFGRPPPPRAELERFIHTGVFDVYVIGTEECENSIQKSLLFSSKAKWVAALTEIMGDAYAPVAAETMQAIHLIVFVRKELCMFVNNVESERVPTGYGDILGNKGAVAVSLDIGTHSFLFVNSHFQSGEGAVARRNADYHKVNGRLSLRAYDRYVRQRAALPVADPYAAQPLPLPDRPAQRPAPPLPRRQHTQHTEALQAPPLAAPAPPAASLALPALSPREARGYDQPQRAYSHTPSDATADSDAVSVSADDGEAWEDDGPRAGPQSLSLSSKLGSALKVRGGSVAPPPTDVARRARALRAHLPLEHQALYDDLLHPAQDAVSRFDCVVWMGDLNYRVQALRKVADYMLKHGMLAELLGVDELLQEMRAKQVFEGFREGAVTFPPTYKYDVGTNRYDSSEKSRVPSWTDRVLWRADPARVLLEKYGCCQSVTTSDHRPVFAHLLVKVGRGQTAPVHVDAACNNVCQTQ